MFKPKTQSIPTSPKYVQVRSMYGSAYHVRENIPGYGPTLCGYANWTPTNTTLEARADEMLESARYQHDGWYWCPTCGSVLTGMSEDFFVTTRKENI